AQFNSIGIKLARKAQVPVVPVALKTDAWGIGRIIKEIGRIDPSRPVRFAFGEPLTIQGRGNAQQEAIVEFIGSKLREWKHIP
ncbi:glycerol acyltransferase, partial [Litorilinea aerophila]